MIPGFHGFDLIILLVIALLFFGPKRLPEMGSAIGKTLKEYRKSMHEVHAPHDEEVETPASLSSEEVKQELPAAQVVHERE